MGDCKTVEVAGVENNNELLVMFVILYSEYPATIIPERHKIV